MPRTLSEYLLDDYLDPPAELPYTLQRTQQRFHAEVHQRSKLDLSDKICSKAIRMLSITCA